MKITFLLPCRNFSGGIRCGTRMASELLDRGHDVQILYRRNPANIKLILKNLYNKLLVKSPKDWVSQFQGECASFKTLAAELVGKRDVLVAIGPDCVEDMMELPDECGHRVFYAHGLTLRNRCLREIAWGKDIPIVAVSDYVRQEILASGNTNILGVVPNGIDVSEYFPDVTDCKREAVGAVYGQGIAKDTELILSVFAGLAEQRPDLRLVCFGSCSRPRQLIQSVEYNRLPSVSEARKLYSGCAIWFCASRSEGFGMPLLEAAACGCVVVSTNCGGPNDFLKSGTNGVIVESQDSDSMVGAIVNILESKSEQELLAEEAIKTAGVFSWSSAACQMENVLESVVTDSIEII